MKKIEWAVPPSWRQLRQKLNELIDAVNEMSEGCEQWRYGYIVKQHGRTSYYPESDGCENCGQNVVSVRKPCKLKCTCPGSNQGCTCGLNSCEHKKKTNECCKVGWIILKYGNKSSEDDGCEQCRNEEQAGQGGGSQYGHTCHLEDKQEVSTLNELKHKYNHLVGIDDPYDVGDFWADVERVCRDKQEDEEVLVTVYAKDGATMNYQSMPKSEARRLRLID